MAKSYYRKPYLDSGVFIAWIKGEVIKAKDAQGNEIIIDRGKIGESILTLAESRVYPIIISTLTLVEVHKKKGKEKLGADENQNVLDYFQHDFVNPSPSIEALARTRTVYADYTKTKSCRLAMPYILRARRRLGAMYCFLGMTGLTASKIPRFE